MRIDSILSVAAIGIVSVCALATGGCAGGPTGSSVAVGDAAPSWSAADLSGEERSLEAHRGDVVLIDFWATWCGPCKRASPHIQAMHEEYGDEGLEVFAIQVNDENGDAAAYMEEHGYTYTVIPDGTWIGEKYGVRGIPQFFVIDRDGRVLAHQIGFGGNMEESIEDAVRLGLRTDGG